MTKAEPVLRRTSKIYLMSRFSPVATIIIVALGGTPTKGSADHQEVSVPPQMFAGLSWMIQDSEQIEDFYATNAWRDGS